MHVSHKSITRGPYHSTEKRHFLARATWRLHLDAFHEQHCNLEKDWEARASFVIPFAIDHLQLAKGHRVSVGEPIDNARLISITSSLVLPQLGLKRLSQPNRANFSRAELINRLVT